MLAFIIILTYMGIGCIVAFAYDGITGYSEDVNWGEFIVALAIFAFGWLPLLMTFGIRAPGIRKQSKISDNENKYRK